MARTVSQTARTAMYSQETEELFVLLLEIENEDDPSDPIRVALDSENLASRLTVSGIPTYAAQVTFVGGFFAIELPEEAGDNISNVRISIDNVDQSIVTAVRNANRPPSVKMWVVLKSNPNDVEVGPYYMVLESAEYDANFVTGELAFDDVTNRRYPKDEFTPRTVPGLF